MLREGFVFYQSFYESTLGLPDEVRLELFDMICRYGLTGEIKTTENIVAKNMFLLIKPQLDANNKRYKNSKNGGAPTGNQNARKDWENLSKQPKTTEKQPNGEKKQPKEKDKVKVKDKEIIEAIEKSGLEEKVIDLYIDFLNQREANKIKNTLQATKQHLNLLLKQENEAIRLKILEISINNSYRGLFELNEKDLAKLRESEPPKPYQPPPQNDLDPILT